MRKQNPDTALLDGWMDWQLIGTDGRTKDSGEQHNLFLNHGLDAVSSIYGLHYLMDCALVSDGAGVPAITDTAMDGTRFETKTNFSGAAPSLTRVSDGVWDFSVSKFFEYAQGNGDLTQWGFTTDLGQAPTVKERFLDGGGFPRVVTKDSNFQLRLNYTLRFSYGPLVEQPLSFNIPGVGTINARRCFNKKFPGYRDDTDFNLMRALLAGAPLALLTDGAGASTLVYDPNGAYSIQGGPTGSQATPSSGIYVPGSYKRTYSLTVPATPSDQTYTRMLLGDTNTIFGNIPTGMIYVFDTPITKEASKALTLSGLEIAWGRA